MMGTMKLPIFVAIVSITLISAMKLEIDLNFRKIYENVEAEVEAQTQLRSNNASKLDGHCRKAANE